MATETVLELQWNRRMTKLERMRPVLLHYHILKNGGSTIEEILRRSFGAGFASLDRDDRDAEITPGELLDFLRAHPEVQAFSSHQIFYPVPRSPEFLFFDICFLRDPFDRIRSIYDYFRGKPPGDDPIRILAHRHSLGDFVAHLIEEMPWTVTDVQVNLLAHGIVNDVPWGVEDLDAATRRMRETSFLGVVDCFEESLVAGEYAVRTVFPALDAAQERVNESARAGSTLEERLDQFRRDCGEDVFAELMRRNGMDRQLLRRARVEVRRRFEATPHAEERLRELRGGARRRIAIARRDPNPPSSKPGLFKRFRRGLRFLVDLPMSRPGSAFRRLFDREFYGASLWDFVTRGAFDGRDPHPLFDANFYREHSACRPNQNPLAHYLRHGGGRPHPLFDPAYYAARNADVRARRVNPLLHYVLHGAREHRKPNPWFSPEFYFAGCPEARNAANPLVHFLETTAANPHPFFDCESYRREHPEAGNPLADFLRQEASHEAPQGRVARIALEEIELRIGLEKNCGAPAMWIENGEKRFVCPAHLRRLFECLRYDQLP